MSLIGLLILGLVLIAAAYLLPERPPWNQILYVVGGIIIAIAGGMLLVQAVEVHSALGTWPLQR